ncbi:type 1 fimbrial protein [Pseudomonas gingeri]|uniref:Type 1 fimbrial protein n=1 Tax=Pseudomonas gingeri TaxID=117681 RepID=A0A7Y8CLX1_9PSED|nr:type 1 fimbrial protein [Pseudomonas gingeri]NWA01336.1 type 1 fimbrial protein [Pseudomonas gingeri]NWA13861.1 type 1 fimbrial protein [Pseudomonas gingeri]NWA52779.1 type 1 fimbrial protein [Pseudomonas gingeri]NWA96276.1 type 1 fimbrial protein [Pseudomonas gingeri]NWB00088.1 type 1 fimbrial protein [Pseudomonas gingeri]
MKYTLSLFGILLLMGVCSTVQAAALNSGQIRFTGQIVEAACEVSSSGSANAHGVLQRIQVAPGVVVSVDTADNACSGGARPFNASYQPLSNGASSITTVSPKGIVVITYL